MSLNKLMFSLFSIVVGVFFLLSASFAKTMPSDFTELVSNSELIAVVNVFEIKSKGKSNSGTASATIRELILGATSNKLIKLHWNGIAMTELGEWVVFLKKTNDGYMATYGVRSFWKVDDVKLQNAQCCVPFVVLRYPVSSLNFPRGLLSEQFVYFNRVPDKSNPIRVRGFLISDIMSYIKNSDE